ncbi:MAG: amidohydrolase family protein [Sphingomonadaceae bacterium]|nr:amidohydrolase family protein [Sphingomonadaceae bacterium]
MVDAHHHLWDLNAVHYPWLMERGVRRFFGDPAPIQKNYLVSDFRDDHGDLSIVKSVHVQVGVAPEDSLLETRWLQEQSDAHGLPNAIIAFCDLTAEDLAAQLDAHAQSPAFRGVRQIVGRSAEEDAKTGTASLLTDPRFAEGLAELDRRGLSFDLQLVPSQMEAAAELLETLPDLKVALCHAGSFSRARDFGMWHSGIKRLADLPRMICKISGFGMFDPGWTAQSAKTQFDAVVAAFGPARIAFGSNFPVDRLYSDYGSIWMRFAQLARDVSESGQAAMFAETDERFYRI